MRRLPVPNPILTGPVKTGERERDRERPDNGPKGFPEQGS